MEESHPWMEQGEADLAASAQTAIPITQVNKAIARHMRMSKATLSQPTNHEQGTADKVGLLAARYAKGLPLFLDDEPNALDASPPGNSEGIRRCRRRLGQDWIDY